MSDAEVWVPEYDDMTEGWSRVFTAANDGPQIVVTQPNRDEPTLNVYQLVKLDKTIEDLVEEEKARG